MQFSRIKIMTTPTPTDYTSLGVIFSVLTGTITLGFKWINSYFSYKKEFNEDFIEKVVAHTMDGALKDVKSDISKLFELREKDRDHLDKKFGEVMSNFKK